MGQKLNTHGHPNPDQQKGSGQMAGGHGMAGVGGWGAGTPEEPRTAGQDPPPSVLSIQPAGSRSGGVLTGGRETQSLQAEGLGDGPRG